jgi:hypothetical protein
MGLVLFGWMTLSGDLNKFLVLAVGVMLGVLTYGLMLKLLKVPELDAILLKIKGKLAEKG